MNKMAKADQAYAEASDRGAKLLEKLIALGLVPVDKSAQIEAEYACRIALMDEHKKGFWRGTEDQ
jgi:hypothetical protein